MIPFNNLPVADRQAQVNALLIPATKRLPKAVKRNAIAMGAAVKFVWASLQTQTKPPSQAAIMRQARSQAG